MHSRIYQLSETPVNQNELTHEQDYEQYFVGSHADYVAEIGYKGEGYAQDLKWLQNVTKGIQVNVEEGTITVTDKKEYFQEKHETFQNYLEKLNNTTLDDFVKSYGTTRLDLYELQCAFEDKHTFYVDINGETKPLDSFVRSAEENKVYYVGTIMDYHF